MEGERSVRLETLIKKVDWILVFETSVVKLIDWPETKAMFGSCFSPNQFRAFHSFVSDLLANSHEVSDTKIQPTFHNRTIFSPYVQQNGRTRPVIWESFWTKSSTSELT